MFTLTVSRRFVARVVFDQTIETWQQAHVEALAELGGSPATITPDNLETAMLRGAFGIDGESGLHRSYHDLARHYGIKIEPMLIRNHGEEANVAYVKARFFAVRKEDSTEVARRELQRWVDEVANPHLLGAARQRAIDPSAGERAALRALPEQRFEPAAWHQVRVLKPGRVIIDSRFYPAPPELLGQHVWVHSSRSAIAIFANGEGFATQ